MFTINTQWALGKNGVMWQEATFVSSNTIQDQIDIAKKAPNPIDALKTLIAELQKPITNEAPQVKITREEKIKEFQKALDGILAEAKKKEQKLNADALENTDFVRKFGNRVNLGAVVPFIDKQEGETTQDKIQAAFNKAKSNTTRSDAGAAVDIDQEYAMKSKMSNKGGLHLSEYNALATLLESMLKSQTVFDDLKAKNIPSDRKVDSSKLVDLFADFDGDGVIEAVNSVNDAGLWNKFKSIFVDLDAMQSEYLGEYQAINKMKDENTLKVMLTEIGVNQAKDEDLKDFAKRARAALMMSASVSGTAELHPSKALARMQMSDKYKEERGNIEKQVADLQQKITDKNPNIKPEDANKIARSLASIVTVYTTSIGIGSANVDAIMQQLGQAIATPKGNTTFLGIDMGVMAKVVNTEKFKVSLGAGLGGGVSSEGFFAFAHVGAEGKLTMIDRSTLEDIKKSEGNMTATLGVHAGMDLKSFNIVPALTLDALWNDKIDSLDNAMLKMNTIIDKLTVVGTDGKITLDLSKLPANLDPVLRAQLSSLKYLAENVDPKMTPAQQNAHAILIRDRFMQSFKVFMAAQPEYKGFSLAGIRFAVVPGAFLLGPVFQDISVERKAQVVQGEKRRAEAIEQTSIMDEFGLKWDSATRTLTGDGANKTKITLAEGLKWDEKDSKVVFSDGKMPKFTVDTGVINTLGGRGEKTLIVSIVDTKTSTSTRSTEAKAEPLKSDVALPNGVPGMIQALSINKLIERSDVKKFMKAMTENPFNQQNAAKAAEKVKEFKAIITKANVDKDDTEKFQNILNIMIEIDEKLVGDQITRGFNAAKTGKKAFADYKKLLLSRGAKLPKGFSQATMTLGDIAEVSFDKKGLRDQELTIIVTATGIDKSKLKAADNKMLARLKEMTELKTEGSGYMTMARNRRGLSGARGYETGSYIMKENLGLASDENIQAMQKGMGKDLVKIALTNLASRKEFASYKDAINKVDPSKVTLTTGKATVDLGGEKTLTIDLSASKVYSALYGDTAMTSAEQAVCVNVATLYEPSVAGTITENGKTTSAPDMDITDSDTVMLPEVRTSQVAILGAVPNKEKDTPQENQQKPDSKPTTDNNGEIKPPPGGSPAVTPPQPATPVTTPEVIPPTTPGNITPTVK